jgi:hypothetical protein
MFRMLRGALSSSPVHPLSSVFIRVPSEVDAWNGIAQ